MLGGRHEQDQQRRKEDDRVNERPKTRTRHRDRHGAEHLALHTLEREQRDIDEHDDRDRECHGRRDALRDFGVLMSAGLLGNSLPGHRRNHGFQEHDRAVDEETKVNRPERHEVARNAKNSHAEQRDRHRDGDAQRGHERAT